MNSKVRFASAFALILGIIPFATHAAIIGISVPVDSSDEISHPRSDNVWSVSVPPAPFDINTGIGFLINPIVATPGSESDPNDFTLHDHVFSSANTPDPARAVVTFQFDTPTIVKAVEIIQHTNGISKVEGLAGDALNSLVSLGSIFGPSGDIIGAEVFSEWTSQVFDFGNTTSGGTFFQLGVRKISNPLGWATYRIFPLDENGNRLAPAAVPLPAAIWLLGSALGLGMALLGRRAA